MCKLPHGRQRWMSLTSASHGGQLRCCGPSAWESKLETRMASIHWCLGRLACHQWHCWGKQITVLYGLCQFWDPKDNGSCSQISMLASQFTSRSARWFGRHSQLKVAGRVFCRTERVLGPVFSSEEWMPFLPLSPAGLDLPWAKLMLGSSDFWVYFFRELGIPRADVCLSFGPNSFTSSSERLEITDGLPANINYGILMLCNILNYHFWPSANIIMITYTKPVLYEGTPFDICYQGDPNGK